MGKAFKRLIIRCFLLCEIGIFAWVYCFGARGLSYVVQLHAQNKELTVQCQEYVSRIASLERTIQEWETDKAFYQEKIAREQLHMAYDHDQVFLIE